MAQKWLNFFFRASGNIFKTKNKLIKSKSLPQIIWCVLVLIFFETTLAIISLPLYLLVSPKKVQETGFIFPISQKKNNKQEAFKVYKTRRKISLATGIGAGLFLFFKIVLVFATTFFLTGTIELLAATQNWTFDNADNYTYDSAKIEVANGSAQLVANPVMPSYKGVQTNVGKGNGSVNVPAGVVDGDILLWTISFEGGALATITPPSGFSLVLRTNEENDIGVATYWKRASSEPASYSFLITSETPWSTAMICVENTIELGTPIEASGGNTGASGNPTSPSITISNDYNLVFSFYANANATTYSGVANEIFDIPNVEESEPALMGAWFEQETAGSTDSVMATAFTPGKWTAQQIAIKSDPYIYASDIPSIYPNSSIEPALAISWDSFTETAEKNGGEIYYQLSDDDGATWQYWKGSGWELAGDGDYNTSDVVNTKISNFSIANNKIMWRAFLESDGSQQITIDSIEIGYTHNLSPEIANLTITQGEENPEYFYITYDLSDNESDTSSLSTYEYSLTGDFAGEEITMTPMDSDPLHDGVSGLTTSSTGESYTFVWDAQAQVDDLYDEEVYVRLRANDGISDGEYVVSAEFAITYGNPPTRRRDLIETPAQPILNQLTSPTDKVEVLVSGTAQPGMYIDLYDSGELVKRFENNVDTLGNFEELITFDEGAHELIAIAVNIFGNSSEESEVVILNIELAEEIVEEPAEEEIEETELEEAIEEVIEEEVEEIIEEEIEIIEEEIIEPEPVIEETVEPIIPEEVVVEPIVAPIVEEIIPSVPVPTVDEVIEIIEPVELPEIEAPEVSEIIPQAENNVLTFNGKASPNQEVVVYINSVQTLIYRTQADENGDWSVNHSQDTVELAPGQHSVFAVALDKEIVAKSRPSDILTFNVSKNIWVSLFNLLNFQTTIITLIIILGTSLWVFRIRGKFATAQA